MQLIYGDCLEKMKDIPDKSIDMVLCDLPYGTTACKWDVVIPFEPLWKEYKRIIKDRGCIALFGSEPFSSHLRISNIKNYKYEWTWIKNRSGGAVTAKVKPLSCIENISIFYSEQPTYNPIYTERAEEELKKLSKNSVCNNSLDNGVGFNASYIQTRENLIKKYPRRDIYIHTVFNRSKEKTAHPTQKPVALLEYFINTYTVEGETVLDNTMGSGSTGIACINTKRNFIGIEKDDKYFEIAKKRIEEHLTTASTRLAVEEYGSY